MVGRFEIGNGMITRDRRVSKGGHRKNSVAKNPKEVREISSCADKRQ